VGLGEDGWRLFGEWDAACRCCCLTRTLQPDPLAFPCPPLQVNVPSLYAELSDASPSRMAAVSRRAVGDTHPPTGPACRCRHTDSPSHPHLILGRACLMHACSCALSPREIPLPLPPSAGLALACYLVVGITGYLNFPDSTQVRKQKATWTLTKTQDGRGCAPTWKS
jgi:hypothetical protein